MVPKILEPLFQGFKARVEVHSIMVLDDSSKGMHATKHFVNTGHPVIVALPDKPWKWCYIHKIYG